VQRAERVDKGARTLFPVAFLVFKVIWWVYYCLPSAPGEG